MFKVTGYRNISEDLRRRIERAIILINRLAKDEEFKKKVLSEELWDYSEAESPEHIWDSIFEVDISFDIIGKRGRPFSGVRASTRYRASYMNLITKWNWSVESLAGTILHEATHIVGHSHGNNSPKHKGDSVPYKLGRWAKNFVATHYLEKPKKRRRVCSGFWPFRRCRWVNS